jgi:hypothetical protein
MKRPRRKVCRSAKIPILEALSKSHGLNELIGIYGFTYGVKSYYYLVVLETLLKQPFDKLLDEMARGYGYSVALI